MTDEQKLPEMLRALAAEPLLPAATRLLERLGYSSLRRLELEDSSPETFLATYDSERRIAERAMTEQWRSVEMLFQLTGDEIRSSMTSQQSLFGASDAFDRQVYQSFLLFAIDLKQKKDNRPYTRTELAAITREINRLFAMPVSVIFRFTQPDAPSQPDTNGRPRLTMAIVTHRPNRRDQSRDVLEKVSLIHAIRLENPHRAHIDILNDLSLNQLVNQYALAGFDDLQRAWARTLDITELNRRFYKEIADWYFWAVEQVKFPDGAGDSVSVRNATSVIRLLTRLIFVWFLKEKGLVPERLFNREQIEKLLVSSTPDESSFYKAILQNLFFATLNAPMNDPKQPRMFRAASSGSYPNKHYGITSVYRYETLFRDAKRALELFRDVPFLNGGLFECLDPDDRKRPEDLVDGFSDRSDNPLHVPNRLFFGGPGNEVDLNRVYGTRGRRYRVRGLIDILQGYKFTIAENTPVEEEVALDPELLGQVFENLLAAYNPETETTARKETGSFYTPRNVVEYMVDESLLLVFMQQLQAAYKLTTGINLEGLEQRLRDLLSYSLVPATSLFSETEIIYLINAIDNLRMIDPACGSGAFPMGALQKLVYLLGKLDPRNVRWKQRQEERAEKIPDPEAREAAITAIQAAFDRNELDYGRKLYLIENCIYGVDIQSIAVQIAKLRCFIALIVDQRVDRSDQDNYGVRPLPNLETRFVAADTLNGVRPVGQRAMQMALRDDRVTALERQLADVRSRYFSARDRRKKQQYREQDTSLRKQLADHLQLLGWDDTATKDLARWNPYSQNAVAPFFDSEWMFSITDGFDVVIANPPYVRQEQIKHLKKQLSGQYDAYTGTADLYVYFYERGLQLLRDGGVLTFISSNKFFRAGYGQKLRGILTDKTTIQQIIDFGDAPVFTAIAYPAIIVATKQSPALTPDTTQAKATVFKPTLTPSPTAQMANSDGEHKLLAVNWDPTAKVQDFPEVMAQAREAIAERTPSAPLVLQRSLTADGWRLEGASTQRLLDKLRRAGQPLGEYVKGRFYYGIKTGFNEAFVVNQEIRDRLIAEHPSSAEILKPFLRGRDVKRWQVEFANQYLIKLESSENVKHPWSGMEKLQAEKTLQQIYPAVYEWLNEYRQQLITRSDQGRYFWELRACAYWKEFEQPKIILGRFMNRATFAFDRKQFYHNDALYMIAGATAYTVGVINSLPSWWFLKQICTDLQNGYIQAFRENLFQVPIPPNSNPAPVEQLVEQILAIKADNPRANVSARESEINERVYALYGLRSDEIRMIEESIQGVTR